MERIYLIGLPGVGKSTLGRKLAMRVHCDFVDLDCALENEMGMSVQDIFSQYGEPFFRDCESRFLQSFNPKNRTCIIATGGGIVLRGENREYLRENGAVFFIDRSPAAILESIDVSQRPLLVKDPMRLWTLDQERHAIYRDCCHIHISLEGTVEHSLEQLYEAVLMLKERQNAENFV